MNPPKKPYFIRHRYWRKYLNTVSPGVTTPKIWWKVTPTLWQLKKPKNLRRTFHHIQKEMWQCTIVHRHVKTPRNMWSVYKSSFIHILNFLFRSLFRHPKYGDAMTVVPVNSMLQTCTMVVGLTEGNQSRTKNGADVLPAGTALQLSTLNIRTNSSP